MRGNRLSVATQGTERPREGEVPNSWTPAAAAVAQSGARIGGSRNGTGSKLSRSGSQLNGKPQHPAR